MVKRVQPEPEPWSVPLSVQLQCAKRELALRRNSYPRFVNAKRMNQFKAEEEIEAMSAIVKTLEKLIGQSPGG